MQPRTINSNTLDKPEWIHEKDPTKAGIVPLLEYNGNVINESDVIMHYVIGRTGKEKEMITLDPMRRAERKCWSKL